MIDRRAIPIINRIEAAVEAHEIGLQLTFLYLESPHVDLNAPRRIIAKLKAPAAVDLDAIRGELDYLLTVRLREGVATARLRLLVARIERTLELEHQPLAEAALTASESGDLQRWRDYCVALEPRQTDAELFDAFAGAISPALASIDVEIRTAVPKCPACGRPDGGLIIDGMTPYEAGLVDRKRCPEAGCPMRSASPLDSQVVRRGAGP